MRGLVRVEGEAGRHQVHANLLQPPLELRHLPPPHCSGEDADCPRVAVLGDEEVVEMLQQQISKQGGAARLGSPAQAHGPGYWCGKT